MHLEISPIWVSACTVEFIVLVSLVVLVKQHPVLQEGFFLYKAELLGRSGDIWPVFHLLQLASRNSLRKQVTPKCIVCSYQ